MMKLTALALPALITVSIPADATPHDRLARIGQEVRVDGMRVRPIKLIEDSRCPANARCIWAGRVVVRAEVRTGHRRERIDLTLGEGQRVGNRTLTLTTVLPVKYTNPVIRPATYRFGFEVGPAQ